MLLSLGGDFVLETKGNDRKADELFSTKFRVAESAGKPDFVLECKEHINLKPRGLLNEIFVKPFCITDGYELAYIKGGKKLIIPFQDIGNRSPIKVKYERGFAPDWLRFIFDQIFGIHVLKKGFSLFHAAGIIKDGVAILLPSWRFAGKTTVILYMLLHANVVVQFIGDDGAVIYEAGTAQVYSDALHLDYTHLKQFPEIKNPFSSWMKMRLFIKEQLTNTSLPKSRAMEYLAEGIAFFLCPGSKTYSKVCHVIPDVTVSKEPKPVRRVCLLTMGRDIQKVSSRKIDADEIVRRMTRAMLYERKELLQLYHAYAYATGTQNEFIEKSQQIETQVLAKALKNAECLELEIPIVAQKKLSDTLREVASIIVL